MCFLKLFAGCGRYTEVSRACLDLKKSCSEQDVVIKQLKRDSLQYMEVKERKEMFYLTTHSTHFILRLYGFRQDSTYHGLCYTSRGALAETRNSSMGPPHEGLIHRTMSERSYHGATSRSQERRKEGNVLFNDALNTFYLWLYGIRYMVNDHR